jgi:hypothetical protein
VSEFERCVLLEGRPRADDWSVSDLLAQCSLQSEIGDLEMVDHRLAYHLTQVRGIG